MIRRLSKNDYFMSIAIAVSARSTCIRRAVGCVLVDEQGRIMCTGFNGVPRGQTHCIDEPCLGANMPSGEGLELCRAIHAETNAIAQCKDTLEIYAIYTTTFPCVHCLKQLANTSAKELHFMQDYKGHDTQVEHSMKLFRHRTSFLSLLEEKFNEQRQGSHTMGRDTTVATAGRTP